jgi:uncharacterized membrane protein
MKVGQEHVVSMVNTLAMAYASTAMPLLLLLSVNSTAPFWITLNGELISEEILRAILGSFSLVLAVPITTLLASRFLKGEKLEREYEIA